MSREEKIKTMHALWEDLARDDEAIESPSWHAAVLKETEARVLSGAEPIHDWEDAKRELRRRME
ncbi:MAG: addiction module protein [Verrucomicrobiae bacterium]|nr:addiction module protein [Verrucomicrobiae bacterium]